MNKGASSIHKLVRYVPLAASLLGMILIFGSIVFFFESDVGRIVGATIGIVVLLGAVWYAANPFFKRTRRYLLLRTEVVRFIGLVRELNNAVVRGAPADEIERAKSELHNAVDRIGAAAGRVGGHSA
jgi:hypothetical protein